MRLIRRHRKRQGQWKRETGGRGAKGEKKGKKECT